MRSGDVRDDASTDPGSGYALLDAGDGRRLERFGSLVLDRPAPGATGPRRAPARWREADLRFEPGRGWSGRTQAGGAGPAVPWDVNVGGLTMELRATSSGGVGLYPEHVANLAWLEAEIRARLATLGQARVLNLFAHTGLATLSAARTGALVAHVDAARASVAWARRNAGRNGLAGREIRWLVDDARAFVEREARRGRRYEGVILDPPSAGHARSGRWTLRDDLPALLAACAAVAADDAFVLFTAHSTGLTGDALAAMLEAGFRPRRERPSVTPRSLRAESGAGLDLGWAVRLGAAGGGSASNAAP